MNAVEHLRALFNYDQWANQRLLEALRANLSTNSLQILAHILTTKQEYFERLYGKDSTGFDFWPEVSLDVCAAMAETLAENYDLVLSQLDDEGLSLKSRYKTSEGVACENTYREIFDHVLLHSSIHRGNIIVKMREAGFDPPKIDYIIYLRQLR